MSNAFGKWLEMDFEVKSEGLVYYTIIIKNTHLATPKAAHGGVIAAFVDAALGVAGLSAIAKDQKVVSTIEYKLNFLSPAFLDDELLAIGKVEQKGNRILISSCDVFCKNRNNVLIAKALGTFNIYDAVKAGY